MLRCEYLAAPIGIDAALTRLSWMMADEQKGSAQTAYQLFVGTDSLQVANGKANPSLITYSGKSLHSVKTLAPYKLAAGYYTFEIR